MTRSAQKAPSRREIFTKSIRARAQHEGVHFSTALNKIKAAPVMKHLQIPQNERRNPGRNGDQWNGSTFISHRQVDDGEFYDEDVTADDFKYDFAENTTSRHTEITISILDIARPAKRKGAAKDFEVIGKVREVIALEDEDDYLDDDMWEAIFDEQTKDARTSYSSVLRGG